MVRFERGRASAIGQAGRRLHSIMVRLERLRVFLRSLSKAVYIPLW